MTVELSVREKIYAIGVAVSAAALISYLAFVNAYFDARVLIIFGPLTFLIENLSINLPQGGAVSVSSTIILATLMIFGPLTGALTAVFNAVVWRDIKRRTSPFRWLFNGSQGALAAGLSGLVYVWSGGNLLYRSGGFSTADFPYLLLSVGLAATIFFLVNTILVSVSIGLAELTSPVNIWRANVLWAIPNYVALLPLALAFAQIYVTVGATGLALIIIPLLVARQTFQIFVNLKSTYLGTVEALVAALEAKDPYTRGHSERVAALAEKIGRRLKLSAGDLDILRYAGALHDIGKIGTARNVLRKPGKLSEEEYNRIRQHPELGALILQEIKFMDKVIPVVFHHHEHVDGKGYADGFKGEEIPLLARILAVADAYDAMTSPRPYRPAMTPAVACQELIACSGSQFDHQVVNAFIEVMGINVDENKADAGLQGQLNLDEPVTVKNADN